MRNEIQELLKNKYIEYGKSSTLVADMGLGKTKLGINIANELFNEPIDILVISPKKSISGLIKNGNVWQKELEKFPSKHNWYFTTIQGACKWDYYGFYDTYKFIILDEVHEILSPKRLKVLDYIQSWNIKILGLTGTPDDNNEFKAEAYKKYCPIIYRYLNSANDCIINKTKLYVLYHKLNNGYKYKIQTKKKQWILGELEAYKYFDKTMSDCKIQIENNYYESVKQRANNYLKSTVIDKKFKLFISKLISGTLNEFREEYWAVMKSKNIPYEQYKILRNIQSKDYAKFGMNANYFSMLAPDNLNHLFYKYIWARDNRKQLLMRLDSTANVAKEIVNRINLNDEKVLIFSEENNQVSKITDNCYYSKNSDAINKENLAKFESKEILSLGTSKALSLGVNLTNLRYAILESFVGSETRNSQSMGRLNRLDISDVGTFIVIVVKDTVSEDWFNNIVDTFNTDDITYFEDINKLIKKL